MVGVCGDGGWGRAAGLFLFQTWLHLVRAVFIDANDYGMSVTYLDRHSLHSER